jgi:hypothetical protein
MKTLQMTKKTLALGCLLIGALLLISPAIAFAQTTVYTNTSGENATLNVTNNQAGANFTVRAAGSPGLSIPFTTNSQLTGQQTFYIYSVGGFIESSSGQGVFTEYPLAYGSSNASYVPGSLVLQYGYGNTGETLYNYLSSLHSVYMFTGTGSGDSVTLYGGLTADTFSITTPGTGDSVTINSGLGNSTYNIVLGQTGTVTINALNSASAYNYYNIVY